MAEVHLAVLEVAAHQAAPAGDVPAVEADG
jgi:hypothetical protein